MTTFDGWEAQLCGDAMRSDEALMHFRTKGSKNGVRRFQQPDGTWTPLGLAERKKREGWGETRKERKAQKRLAKAERKQAKKAARAAAVEQRRQKDYKNLSDEELQQKINRLKLEKEYKDMKRSPLLESGMKLIDKYITYKNDKAERAMESNRQKIEMERLKTQQIQAKSNAASSMYNAKKAKQERKEMKQSRKAGLKYERKAGLVKAKTENKKESRGALRTWLKKRAENSAMGEKAWRQKQLDMFAKQRNAEFVSQQNAEKARYNAETERYKAAQATSSSKQAASERGWRETQAKTEYEKERKKKKSS